MIESRKLKIATEEETRKEVRKVQLCLLTKLDEVCRKNGLMYYLAFGTCLGALRHKGFIPWDDDIDVLMPYADSRKLIELQKQFGEKIFVQCKETDPDFRSIAMRLRNEDTTCIEADEADLKTHKGIYIDIYPYYECPNNKIIRTINILKSNFLKILVNNRPPMNHGEIAKKISKCILALYSGERRLKKIAKLEKQIASVKGTEILDYYGQDITLFTAISYPKEWFGKPQKLEFEGRFFNGATEPEKYMRKRYGEYMKFPPPEDRVVHHTYVKIDPFKSYIEYER